MARYSSLGNSQDAIIQREINSKYDNVKVVAANIDAVVTVSLEDIPQLISDLQDAKDFTGITVVPVEYGTNSSWDKINKILYVETTKGDQGLQGLQGLKGETGAKGYKGDKGDPGIPGVNGTDGINGADGYNGNDGTSITHSKLTSTTNPLGTAGSPSHTDTYTLYGDWSETMPLGSFVVQNGPKFSMDKETYDTNLNGIVDDSEALGGKSLNQIETERTEEIRLAGLGLGTTYSVANISERDNLSNLVVSDKVYVSDDGDTKWAQYIVTAVADGNGNTSTFEKIMDEDVYLNAQSKESVKATYESNPDTNVYNDAEKSSVAISLVLDTTAKTLPGGINELKERSDVVDIDRTNIHAELNNTQLGAGLSADGTYVYKSGTNYIDTATSLANADSVLDTAIKNEITAEAATRTSKDNILQANIDAETSIRVNNDHTLQTNIDNEETTRSNNDTLLQSNIDNEASTRSAADITLQGNIDTEITARSNDDNTLQTNIDTEATTRSTNDGDLTTLTTANKSNLVDAVNELNTDKYEKSGGTIGGNADITGTLYIGGHATLASATVNGDLHVKGTTTTVDSTVVAVADNQITLNSGETGAGISKGSAGLRLDRGTLNDYVFGFSEHDQTFTLGEIEAWDIDTIVGDGTNAVLTILSGTNTRIIGDYVFIDGSNGYDGTHQLTAITATTITFTTSLTISTTGGEVQYDGNLQKVLTREDSPIDTGVMIWNAATYQAKSTLDLNLNSLNTANSIVNNRNMINDGAKLDTVESGATADQTGSEIKSLYEAEANTNAYTDSNKSDVVAMNMNAAKELAAMNITDMEYGVDGLSVIYYDGVNNFETLTYGADGLSNVAHTIGNVLKGNTALTYTNSNLTSSVFTAI